MHRRTTVTVQPLRGTARFLDKLSQTTELYYPSASCLAGQFIFFYTGASGSLRRRAGLRPPLLRGPLGSQWTRLTQFVACFISLQARLKTFVSRPELERTVVGGRELSAELH